MTLKKLNESCKINHTEPFKLATCIKSDVLSIAESNKFVEEHGFSDECREWTELLKNLSSADGDTYKIYDAMCRFADLAIINGFFKVNHNFLSLDYPWGGFKYGMSFKSTESCEHFVAVTTAAKYLVLNSDKAI